MTPKIFFTPFEKTRYTVCSSRKYLEALCEQEGLFPVDMPETNDATLVEYGSPDAILLYDDGFDETKLVSLLVHECVHIWQNYIDYIGEKNPSIEFQAYSIQDIFTNVYGEYKRQVNETKTQS